MSGTPAEAGGRDGGTVLRGRSRSGSGAPAYRLHVPGGAGARPGLIVLLHGCTQDAEDVAAGTRLDARAAGRGLLVLCPEQDAAAHPQRCWRWFEEAHQGRRGGEPAALRELVDRVVTEHGVDPDRVYLAGLSAGAGMAVVLASVHAERFAAVAAHSGVPYAAAGREADAAEVLRGGGPTVEVLARRLREAVPGDARLPRLLAIHGADDDVVRPETSRRLVAAWLAAAADPAGPPPPPDREERIAAGGDGFSCLRRRWGPPDRPGVEAWFVDGLGHAWSGGSPDGTFTEPAGPDATGIVLRFLEPPAGEG